MDYLKKAAADVYQEYQSSHDLKKTGGHELNSGDNSTGEHSAAPKLDHDEVLRNASPHGSGDLGSLFQSALGFLDKNKEEHGKPPDDDHVTEAHRKAYTEGGASHMSASSLGSAAALEVFSKLVKSDKGTAASSGHGKFQTEFIGKAMEEAAKLFGKSGAASGNKQDAVNGAAMTAMKLYMQSNKSGGLSGLINKFM